MLPWYCSFSECGCVSTTCSPPRSLCGLIPCVYMHKPKCHSPCVVSNLSRVGVVGENVVNMIIF